MRTDRNRIFFALDGAWHCHVTPLAADAPQRSGWLFLGFGEHGIAAGTLLMCSSSSASKNSSRLISAPGTVMGGPHTDLITSGRAARQVYRFPHECFGFGGDHAGIARQLRSHAGSAAAVFAMRFWVMHRKTSTSKSME